MAVCLLDKNLWFPDPHLGEEDGLVAIGGDLSVDRLILAYSNGFFPWYSFKDQQPLWYCPLQRFVIFPNEIHVSHSMKQLLKKNPYRLTINKDFEGVMRGCATAQNRNELEGAWLGPNIIKAYTELYGRHAVGRRTLWRHPGQMLLRREYVLLGAECLQVGIDLPGANVRIPWRPTHRLPVRDAPSLHHGRSPHPLRRIHRNHQNAISIAFYFQIGSSSIGLLLLSGLRSSA